jgi:hypothetical protein
MRFFSMLLIVHSILFLGDTSVFAQPPIVSHNVPVLQHATPSQCHAWKGRVAPEGEEYYSRFGQDVSMSGPGIRSCTGCTIDSNSHDCVCRTCYDYFNGY